MGREAVSAHGSTDTVARHGSRGGGGAEVQFLIGAIPEGQKLVLSACSSYGGDAGEKYSVNIVPPGPNPDGYPVDGSVGQAQWLYAMAGGAQTIGTPLNLLNTTGWPNPLPGPCTLTLATTAESTAELVVILLGYLEPL